MMQSSLAALLESTDLRPKLLSLCAERGIQEASLAVSFGERSVYLRADGNDWVGPDDSMPTLVGCLAKSMTASVLTMALAKRSLSPSATIGAIAPSETGIWAHDRLRLLTATQLLTHTHGLDDSFIGATQYDCGAPSSPDSDIAAMLAEKPLFTPGDMYSYGSGGATLAARLIEHLTGITYVDAMTAELFGPLAISPIAVPNIALDDGLNLRGSSPATGGELGLSIRDLLTYVKWHAGTTCARTDDDIHGVPHIMRSHSHALPGWNPFERSICLGWKCYESGWYGHNAILAGTSVIVRFSPSTGVALVVAGRSDHIDAALTIFMHILGRSVPEFSRMKVPRRIPRQNDAEGLPSGYSGRYKKSGSEIHIDSQDSGLIRLNLVGQSQAENTGPISLSPAEHNVFFSDSARAAVPFVQFLKPDPTGEFQYLWNGTSVWPRATQAS